MNDADPVADSQALISVAEFARRQLAVVERQMLSATDLADLINLSITGIRQLSAGSEVELWLHDPVGELERQLDVVGVLSGTVRLLEDSYSFVSLYDELPEWNRTTSGVFNGSELFKSGVTIEQTLMLPVLDHELLVGSVHVGNPRSVVLMDETQMAILSDFVAKMPLLINRLVEMNRIRDFVLLGPASHVANRAGLLRDTDAIARISEDCFGVMVVDAPIEEAGNIVERWETELQGQFLDDGAGGMIELRTKSSFRHCELEALKDADASEVACRLVSSIEQSLMTIPN